MLKIRFTRRGKKNKAFFRLVVAEHTAPIKGRFLEALGFLNPHTKERNFKADKIKYWLEKGAQCSDTAHNLLVKEGIIKGPKRAIKIKKKEEAGDSAPASAETSATDKSLADKPTGKEKAETKADDVEKASFSAEVTADKDSTDNKTDEKTEVKTEKKTEEAKEEKKAE